MCHTAATICTLSIKVISVFRDTCVMYVIHTCFLRSSFAGVPRCLSRVSADESLRKFGFKLFKHFWSVENYQLMYFLI